MIFEARRGEARRRVTRANLRALHALSALLGALPPGLGQHAIARRIARMLPDSPGLIARQTLVNGAIVELDLADRIQAEAFLIRRYAPDVVAAIASRLGPGDVFLDVGANVGLVSFSTGALVPDVRVHAFEPHPVNARQWHRNHQLNPKIDATLVASAVGAEDGQAALAAGEESGWHHIADSPSPGTTEVAMITLDRYAKKHHIDSIAVLKLDIEGHEPEALQGSERLLSEGRIQCVVCELNDFHLTRKGTSRGSVIESLGRFGYVASRIPRVGAQRFRRVEAEPSDLVFDRRDRVPTRPGLR